jgi:hypothetical protein
VLLEQREPAQRRAGLAAQWLRRQRGRGAAEVRFVEKLKSDPRRPERFGRAEEAPDRADVAEDEVGVRVGDVPVVVARDQPRAAGLYGGVRRLDRLLRECEVTPDEDVDVVVRGNSCAVHGCS